MQAYPVPAHRPRDFSDLLDEEFDSFDIKQPFSRKPVRQQNIMLCAEKTWDDEFDSMDMLCELE